MTEENLIIEKNDYDAIVITTYYKNFFITRKFLKGTEEECIKIFLNEFNSINSQTI